MSCNDGDDTSPSTQNSEPYLYEAKRFTTINYGFSADSSEGCGTVISVYDSIEQGIPSILCHVIAVPDNSVLEDFSSYEGILRIYPNDKHSCVDPVTEPPINYTIPKAEILFFRKL